ncbi:hypothetical protein HYH03_015512 [Edaphochlamys debaryana]|uniref:Peptidase M11 gametolysin domain-containing protein n=1 Tax=Edaphochlamys debaryana TaxID=47281 RepID=A0A836BQV2_9CHLO|nr:hypothetical protein HYH03_015512 [Edaphochlamys debaryana]|eukprot:KAG2485801.1 hypothetical protein HYH03_015512 [Edaphochlamys debaryana]
MVLKLSASDECLASDSADLARVSGMLWAPHGGVAAQLNACSYGRFRILPNSSQVIEITLPCSPDILNCQIDLIGNLAKQQYEAMPAGGRLRFRQFTHRVHIMPYDAMCTWSGLGDTAGPMSWLMPSSLGVDKPGTWMQELLHNFGMHHGGRDSVDNEYGDFSTWMGSAYSSCPSAPELRRLGWAAPLVNLNSTDFPAATTRTDLILSATALGPDGAMIRIQPNWLLGPAYDKGDATLDAEYVYKLSVHEALASVDNAAPSPEFNPHFLLMHLIGQGQTLSLPQYGLLIQARELVDNGMRMVVDVCRYRFDPSVECRLPPVPTVTGTRAAAPPAEPFTAAAPAPGSQAPIAQAPEPRSVTAASQPQAPFTPTKAAKPCPSPAASQPQAPFTPTKASKPCPSPAASQTQAPFTPTKASKPCPSPAASQPQAPFNPTKPAEP